MKHTYLFEGLMLSVYILRAHQKDDYYTTQLTQVLEVPCGCVSFGGSPLNRPTKDVTASVAGPGAVAQRKG